MGLNKELHLISDRFKEGGCQRRAAAEGVEGACPQVFLAQETPARLSRGWGGGAFLLIRPLVSSGESDLVDNRNSRASDAFNLVVWLWVFFLQEGRG